MREACFHLLFELPAEIRLGLMDARFRLVLPSSRPSLPPHGRRQDVWNVRVGVSDPRTRMAVGLFDKIKRQRIPAFLMRHTKICCRIAVMDVPSVPVFIRQWIGAFKRA